MQTKKALSSPKNHTSGSCKQKKWQVYLGTTFQRGWGPWALGASGRAWWSSWSLRPAWWPCGRDRWGWPRSTCRSSPGRPSKSWGRGVPSDDDQHVPGDESKRQLRPPALSKDWISFWRRLNQWVDKSWNHNRSSKTLKIIIYKYHLTGSGIKLRAISAIWQHIFE